MIKQECIGIPDMILLLMIFCFKKIKIKAEIVLSPGGAYFSKIKVFKIFSKIVELCFEISKTLCLIKREVIRRSNNTNNICISN